MAPSTKTLFITSCFILFASIATQTHGQSLPRTISVSGVGTVSAPPDTATINTGVLTTAPTAQAALTANNQQFEQVLEALNAQGVNRSDVQTTFFNVNPQFQIGPNGEQQGIIGYQVNNQVNVVVRDLDNLGAILDALVTAGSNTVSGVNFSIEDNAEFLRQARTMAVAEATSRANVFAQAAGVQVGNIIAISEQSIAQPQFSSFGASGLAAASVPIATGQLDVSATVFLQFELIEA